MSEYCESKKICDKITLTHVFLFASPFRDLSYPGRDLFCNILSPMREFTTLKHVIFGIMPSDDRDINNIHLNIFNPKKIYEKPVAILYIESNISPYGHLHNFPLRIRCSR